MNINAKTQILMVIGDPVKHSLSPMLHNFIYKKVGIDRDYVFVAVHVKSENLADFIQGIKAMGIRGVSVTIPHKSAIMKYLDSIDSNAAQIGAVNTIVNVNGELYGYNTDSKGAVIALEKHTDLTNKQVCVLGAGGAARAVCFGVSQKGTKLIILNRTLDKANILAKEFNARAYTFSEINDLAKIDIIINTTPVGLKPDVEKSPLASNLLLKKHIVFDSIYTPMQTQLLADAKAVGADTISGIEMFIYQAIAQIKLYTGQDIPEQVQNEALSYIKQFA